MNNRGFLADTTAALCQLVAQQNCFSRFTAWPWEKAAYVLRWHKVSVTAAMLAAPSLARHSPFSAFVTAESIRYGFARDAVCRQIGEIAAALRRAGITHTLLKGPLWSDPVYPRNVGRHLGDIDVLVKPEARYAAVEALAGVDLQVDRSTRNPEQDFANRGEIMMVPAKNSAKLRVPVEVHWHPVPALRFMRRLNVPTDDFFADCAAARIGDNVFPLPPREVRFLFLAVHATCQHQFKRFLPLLDLAYLLEAEGEKLDWVRLCDLATRWRAGVALYASLRYLRRFSDRRKPLLDELTNRLAPQIPRRARAVIGAIGTHQLVTASEHRFGYRRKLLRLVASVPCSIRLGPGQP